MILQKKDRFKTATLKFGLQPDRLFMAGYHHGIEPAALPARSAQIRAYGSEEWVWAEERFSVTSVFSLLLPDLSAATVARLAGEIGALEADDLL